MALTVYGSPFTVITPAFVTVTAGVESFAALTAVTASSATRAQTSHTRIAEGGEDGRGEE
jgi:hypothetical protein